MNTASAALTSLTQQIIACAMAVHEQLGPGFFERVYQRCLEIELQTVGLCFERQRTIPLIYRGIRVNAAYRFDFVVEGSVLVEVKAVETLLRVHQAQVINYLKLTGIPIGLLMNLNVPLLKDGLRRLEHPSLYSSNQKQEHRRT